MENNKQWDELDNSPPRDFTAALKKVGCQTTFYLVIGLGLLLMSTSTELTCKRNEQSDQVECVLRRTVLGLVPVRTIQIDNLLEVWRSSGRVRQHRFSHVELRADDGRLINVSNFDQQGSSQANSFSRQLESYLEGNSTDEIVLRVRGSLAGNLFGLGCLFVAALFIWGVNNPNTNSNRPDSIVY